MPYVLCTRDYWLGFDKKSRLTIVESVEDAYKWPNKKRAQNTLKGLSKQLKPYGFNVKELTEIPMISENDTSAIDEIYDIDGKIKEMRQFACKIEERKKHLIGKIRRLELELTDIEHYAEFNELNAGKGYQVYKMLHDTRKERRKYKDELQKIELMLSSGLSSQAFEELLKNVNAMKKKKYRVRVREDLFRE